MILPICCIVLALTVVAQSILFLRRFEKLKQWATDRLSAVAENQLVVQNKANYAIQNADDHNAASLAMIKDLRERVAALEAINEENGTNKFDELFLQGMQNIVNFSANDYEKLNVEGIKHGR